MTFASSSSVQVAYAKETTFGVIPTIGNNKLLRITGESLTYDISKQTSEEINSSRTVSSQIPVSASASGGVNTEISYHEYDPFLEATLQSTFTKYGTDGVGTTFTGDFTATTITASVAPIGSSAFTTLKKGQWFSMGSTTGLNKGKLFRVSKVTAPTATVITLDAGTPASVETGIASCKVQTSRLTNGSTQSSFTLERQSPDISEYWAYSGMTVASMEVNMATGARSTFAFNFMGSKAQRSGTGTQLPGTATASDSYDIHSGSTGPVCVLWVDGAELVGTFVQSVKLTYDNTLREQNALNKVGAVGIGSGTIKATGAMEVYFANGDLYDKFINNTNVELTFSSLDGSGNGYIFTLPKVNLGKVNTGAGAKDQDMMLSIEFTGLNDNANADATLRKLMFIDRVGASAP